MHTIMVDYCVQVIKAIPNPFLQTDHTRRDRQNWTKQEQPFSSQQKYMTKLDQERQRNGPASLLHIRHWVLLTLVPKGTEVRDMTSWPKYSQTNMRGDLE